METRIKYDFSEYLSISEKLHIPNPGYKKEGTLKKNVQIIKDKSKNEIVFDNFQNDLKNKTKFESKNYSKHKR